MLSKPLLLTIDALGLQAWQMHDCELTLLASFAPGEATAVRAWLSARRRRESCRILVNLADEAYEIEDLPRVRGADRRALLARRTAAWFPHPEFARACALGPAPDGRKGFERVLFAGLERGDELRPWLEAIRAGGARITRLIPAASLVPLVLAATGQAATSAGPQLVAGFGRAGLRISLVADGHTQFSRLVGHGTLADATHSGAWLEEVERTRDYLLAQHRLPDERSVPIRMLETPDRLQEPPRATDASPQRPGEAPAFLSPSADGNKLDHSAADGQPDFDRRLLLALAHAPVDLGWRPPSLRKQGGALALALAPRTLALAGIGAAIVLGCGIWYVEHEAAAAEAAGRAARLQPATEPPPPAIDPPLAALEPGPPQPAAPPPCPAPEVQRPVSAAADLPAPRRIDGILLRPDGEALVWLDGTLTSAREAGLQLAGGGEAALSPAHARHTRLRAGDRWTAPEQPMATSPAPPSPSARTLPAVPDDGPGASPASATTTP